MLSKSRNRLLRGFGIAAIVVVLIGVVAGCGGGSSEPEPLSKTAFVDQANAICLEAEQEREQGTKDLPAGDEGEPSDDEEELVIEALVAPVGTMAEELADLGAPKGDQRQVEAIVAAFEAGVEELEADPVAPGSASAFAKANELALAYGLTNCSI